MNEFDKILEKQIGFGTYQLKTMLMLGMIDLYDGMELGLMSLILPVLKKEFNLNED